MFTDVELGAMNGLRHLVGDKLSKKILDVATEMLEALDVDVWYGMSDEEQEDFLREYADEIDNEIKDAVQNDRLPKKKAADWEILASFAYGDREIFIGENPNPEREVERYLVGEIERNELFERYVNCSCGDSYGEMSEIYSQRIQGQIEKVKAELARFPYDRTVIGKDSVDSIRDRNIDGEIVVIDPKEIKREYAGADRQLYVAQGGFGCSPNGHGRKVLCKNIFTGNTCYWLRSDILGTLKNDCIPEWVKDRMTDKPIEVLFTFGSWEKYPFQMGYVSITAPSVNEAIAAFRRNWPDLTEGTLNCADYYYREESVARIKESGNGGKCHKSIDITIPVIDTQKRLDKILSDANGRSGGATVRGNDKELEHD